MLCQRQQRLLVRRRGVLPPRRFITALVSILYARRVIVTIDEDFSVLSTKDLVRLEQEEPYGRIEITIK